MDEAAALLRACEVARRGRHEVEPNPMVGCVLLRDGELIAEGWHRAYGGPHAEVEALRVAGERAAGATAVVTLEPCSTRGKTGACTEALVAAGIRRVVVGAVDPNPAHAGAAFPALRAQGIEVDVQVSLAAEALLELFKQLLPRPRPWVIAKWAQSADGCVALAPRDGLPQPVQLSGPEAHARLHDWRAHLDGLIVGVGTVLADDPQLTVRGRSPVRPLRRVVLDPSLRTPPGSVLASSAGEHPCWLMCTPEASESREDSLRAQGVSVFRLPLAPGRDDLLPDALACLHTQGLGRVMVEGGPRTHARLLAESLADAVAVILSPKHLGADGLPALPGERLPSEPAALAERLGLASWEAEALGDDLLLRGTWRRV
ncbi:MAG: riboflavin biosynthesis protein RibD [Planctomycetota bacterium]|nr:MAG: riboflavin biosynthesis protein RibD [Planctomycetota bacterium]